MHQWSTYESCSCVTKVQWHGSLNTVGVCKVQGFVFVCLSVTQLQVHNESVFDNGYNKTALPCQGQFLVMLLRSSFISANMHVLLSPEYWLQTYDIGYDTLGHLWKTFGHCADFTRWTVIRTRCYTFFVLQVGVANVATTSCFSLVFVWRDAN